MGGNVERHIGDDDRDGAAIEALQPGGFNCYECTPTAQEAVAVMRQWPDPLTSDMARALEQHRESLLVEIMSMFDQMQRQLDYSRGGKLGPVDPPPMAETSVLKCPGCGYEALPAVFASAGRCDGRAQADVMGERVRQITAEGWTPEHDDAYQSGELANAAASYAMTEPPMRHDNSAPLYWPWAGSWWKPTDRRRDLVKAGALIIAEIERLDRAALRALAGDVK